MMRKRRMHRALALLGFLAVTGCQEASTGPMADGLTPDEVLELTVLEEPRIILSEQFKPGLQPVDEHAEGDILFVLGGAAR